MPFSGGTFTNVAGATSAAAGQTVQSATWNAIFADYEAAMTQVNSQYSSINTNRNILWMNGGCEVFQRGAGDSAIINVAGGVGTNPYTADRWYVINGANSITISAVTGLVGQSYRAAKYQRNSGQTSTNKQYFCYPIDTQELYRMRGKSVVLSVLLKAGSNYSGGAINVSLFTGTAAGGPTKAGAAGASFTGLATPLSVNTTIAAGTTSLVTATSSVAVGASITQAELQISWTPSGTASTDDSVTIDDCSIEVITTAYTSWTTMNYDRIPFATMLDGCKRFYQKTFSYSTAPASAICTATGGVNPFSPVTPGIFAVTQLAGDFYMQWQLPVELRRAPTSSDYTVYNPVNSVANTAYQLEGGGSNRTIRGEVSLTTKVFALNFTGVPIDGYAFANITLSADIT